jgi:hypothetical protein
MNQGYIGLFRKFFNEHEFWKEKRKYSRAEAWIDLMQSARYKDEPETLYDKRGVYVLEYGDVYISLRYLGERWQWSKNKVKGFLDYLEKRESISFKKKDSHRTIINIVNLKGYVEWIKGKRDSRGTVEGQSRDSEGTKKKKVKKEKKEKKEIKTFSSDSIEYRLAEFFLSEIRKNNPDHKEPNLQKWSKTFDLIIRLDCKNEKEIASLIRWCQKDSFEMSNVLSPNKLRERWDNLYMKSQKKGVGNSRTDRNAAAKEQALRELESRYKEKEVNP